jgi:nucleoside phosphorylase
MPLVDFAIIAGLIEEFGNVRRLVPELIEEGEYNNSEIWYRGTIVAADDTKYSLVAAFQTDMGPQQASALTAKAIQRWDPAYIILVGIAGSFHQSVRIGDVIASVQIFFYDPGKATDRGLRYRPEGYPCDATLVRQFQALALDSKVIRPWQAAAKRSAKQKAVAAERNLADRKKSRLSKFERRLLKRQTTDLTLLRSHEPKVHFGTVASGSLVVASKQMQRRLLSLHGKIAASEMEGAGMLAQTFTHEMPTPAILIKGISDHADPKKAAADDVGYWRQLACENSIRLALAMIRRGRIRPLYTDQFTLNSNCGPLDLTKHHIPEPAGPGNGKVSFRGFPSLVIPKGPITNLSLSIQAITKDKTSLGIHKLVVSFVSRNDGARKAISCSQDEPITLSEVAPQPIGVYLMLAGNAEEIRFSATTPAGHQDATWQYAG